jgi:PAS domain S-box-containing protein
VINRNTFFNPEKLEGIQPGINGKTVMLVSGKYYLANQVFTVFAVLPFSEVLALSLETLSTTAVFLLFFILLSIALSYLAANRIVRPIESLADNARSITAGNMVSTIQIGDTDEIGDLSKAFNTMTSRLFDTISSLKKEIAELKLAKEKIIQQYELLNNIINSLTHPFYVIDANDYTIKLANKAAGFGDLTGKAKCYALTHDTYEPCSRAEHPCSIKKIKETRKPVTLEHIHYDKSGRTMIVEIHGYPIFDNEGKIAQVIEYNLDITERKEAEEKINASLKEKEVLLREIHHRVKNNMQIISSLLNLQSMLLSNKKDIAMLKDSQNRIKAMSLIHEKLYRSENLADININEYINDLATYILQFYETVAFNVTLNIKAEDIWLGIDTAIPCGLIINELMSNSLKHAFPEGRKGEIGIMFEKAGEDELVIIVSDDGSGLPEDVDFRNTKSLGLQLVTTLAENQLQGKIELDRSKGTKFRITFNEIKYVQRF